MPRPTRLRPRAVAACLATLLAISGVVVSLTTPSCGDIGGNRAGKVRADVDALGKAIDVFRIATGRWPAKLEELWERPQGVSYWAGPYVDAHPSDPWGNPYVLASDGRTIAVSWRSVVDAPVAQVLR
jgi:general secretion pathway protein G